MSSSTQTVFRLTSRTGVGNIQAYQEPIPTFGDHEVLVKIKSVSINYRDIAIQNNTYPLAVKDQVIPCSDLAGEVVQVSDKVKNLAVGDTVIASSHAGQYGSVKSLEYVLGGPVDGALREYIVLPASQLVKVSTSAHTVTDWAALIGTGTTAWNCFFGAVPLKPGQTVLVQGTGGVSLTALIIARAAGAKTIVTSSSDEKLKKVKDKYGADYTINYKTHPNWAAEAQRITEGQGVDHIIENGGIGTIGQSIEAAAMGGTISLVGFLATLPQDQVPDVTIMALTKAVTLRGILMGSKQQLEEMAVFFGNHNLPVPIDKTFQYNREDIIAAMQYVASGKHMGKVCINLN
ncbi:hypothetical protein PV08_03866 [Exophiala spinifera]|uniref:Enoyl reductase (ER) domain-containing protein n=1 Tax=Exophiala spinifera TaxID=91928 RepID=A0A0D2BCH4_9EURO|nr:uncharacterized protein PV08_03866 [Exophiala spinifera]KIW16678.1 hypothetical protein PV08_03866 [Exophiala spinifera]